MINTGRTPNTPARPMPFIHGPPACGVRPHFGGGDRLCLATRCSPVKHLQPQVTETAVKVAHVTTYSDHFLEDRSFVLLTRTTKVPMGSSMYNCT